MATAARNSGPHEMSLFEHLGELRRRLLAALLAVGAATCAAYGFAQEIFALLSVPYLRAFPSGQLIGTGPAEAFLLKIKVSFFAGIVIASPLIFYQLWRFIAPGLYAAERAVVLPAVGVTTLFFLLGIFFCYTVVLPFTFSFFSQEYESIGVSPAIRVSEQMSMLIQAMVGFGIVFQLPVLAFLLGRFGVITHRTLIQHARYAIVIIFVTSAVLTPPDVISQLLMAAPLLTLYGLSIVVVKWTAVRSTEGKG